MLRSETEMVRQAIAENDDASALNRTEQDEAVPDGIVLPAAKGPIAIISLGRAQFFQSERMRQKIGVWAANVNRKTGVVRKM